MAVLYEIFGSDAHAMTKALLEAGEVNRRIPVGAAVALKPNLVVAGRAEDGATTHPGVLSGCIEYLREHGVRDVSIIEGSWVGDRTDRAMKVCGYDAVCRRYNVPFYDLKRDRTRRVDTPLRPMEICARALDAGYLINLPVLKGHCQTVMTCALKNCKGCLPDAEKRRFHSEGLMRPIAALATALKPDLTIVDSICGDLNFEEGGTPIQTNRMFMSADPVQIDAYGCRLMGLSLSDVPYISLAEQWGVGSAELRESDIVSLNKPQSESRYPASSGIVRQLTRRVHADSACSACYAALVRGLYIAREQGIPVNREIIIGQGWRGKSDDRIGIGNCCSHAAACVSGCPPAASDVVAFLRNRSL